MKYLNNRNEFLKSKINEEVGGPFHNEITWGDSLVGRFIHNLMRKGNQNVKLLQIKAVEKRLTSILDGILVNSALMALDEDKRKEFDLAILSEMLLNLQEYILKEENFELDECILMNENILKYLENNKEKIEKNEDLKKILEDFSDFLKNIEVDEVGVVVDPYEEKFDLMIENLKSLMTIVKLKPVNTKAKNKSIPVVVDNNSFKYLNENNSIVLLGKFIALINNLSSNKDGKVALNVDFLNNLIVNKDKYKKDIIKIYKEVNRFIVGDKAKTIPVDKLVFESNMDSDIKYKFDIIAEKIARFYKYASQYIGHENNMKDYVDYVNKFVSTMKEINQIKTIPDVIKAVPEKINSYNTFINIINETNDFNRRGIVGRVRDYWNNNVTIKPWLIDRSKIVEDSKDLEQSIDKLDEIVIYGVHPIMEIVKCFNRAYKLHTTQVIPSARTGGKVTNRIFMEYTTFGSGTPETAGVSGGPYRHNKTFNEWENYVLTILGEAKYKPLFGPKTVIKRDGAVVEDRSKFIEKVGQHLVKFINELLDGDELYKKGAQSRFIQKYFDYKVDNDGKLGYGDDSKVNAENANNISTLDFSTKMPVIKESKDLIDSIFVFRPNQGNRLYFNISNIDDQWVYLYYSKSFNYFDKVITNVSNKKHSYNGLSKIEMVKETVYATKISKSLLIGSDGKLRAIPIESIKPLFYSNKDGFLKYGQNIDLNTIGLNILTNNEELFKIKIGVDKLNDIKNLLSKHPETKIIKLEKK